MGNYSKFIVAALAAAGVLLANYGLALSPEFLALVTSGLGLAAAGGVIVVPNKS